MNKSIQELHNLLYPPIELTVDWEPKDTFPDGCGVFQVLYADHCETREYLHGKPCLAYFDGVDTWSERWFFTYDDAIKAEMVPNRRYQWYKHPDTFYGALTNNKVYRFKIKIKYVNAI